jgi:protein required for attachment to host cells
MSGRVTRTPLRVARSSPATQLVLVADNATARLLRLSGRPGTEKLVEIARMEQPEAHLPARALVSDRTGRVFDSGGRTGHGAMTRSRHGAQSDFDPHTEGNERFARRVARRLDTERRGKGFDGLVVIAAKHFLGVLRSQLSNPTRAWVRREVAKDLVRATDAQILRAALA